MLFIFLFFFFFFLDFFLFSFNSEFKKKNAKWRRFGGFNDNSNWAITKPWIDKNWKLEDWIDKTKS